MRCLDSRSDRRSWRLSVADGSPEGLLVVAELDLVCVLDEVEPLAFDLFPVD